MKILKDKRNADKKQGKKNKETHEEDNKRIK